jgi:hypothetical protein
MPQGRVPAREVVCRACGEPFVTERSGKAAFYCRRPGCDEARAASRLVVHNSYRSGGPAGSAGARRLQVVALRVMREQARRERERARFERQWRREVEAWVRAREAPERRRRAAMARRREREARKRADRLARERGRARERARREAERLRVRVQDAQGRAQTLADQLAELERRAGIERPVEAVPVPVADEQLARVAVLLADRPRDREPGRLEVRRAVVALANAGGLAETRLALRRLAVEALAWERRLPERQVVVKGIDTPQAEDVAA